MSFVNYASHEIQLKIVYYGPALCGKTTNLQVIHRMVRDDYKGKLTSQYQQKFSITRLHLLLLTIKKADQMTYTSFSLMAANVNGSVDSIDIRWHFGKEHIDQKGFFRWHPQVRPRFAQLFTTSITQNQRNSRTRWDTD